MRTIVVIPLDEITPAEMEQYELDPCVEVVIDEDREVAIVETI